MKKFVCPLICKIRNDTNYKTLNTCLIVSRKQSTKSNDASNIQSADEPSVVVEKDTNITLIGLNCEQKRNSIDSKVASKLTNAIRQFEADETSPVGVLYGIGGTFCAGYDLNELEREVNFGKLDFLMRHEGSVGPTRRHLRKPIVCGINGFCIANGLELALLCDLRVMEDTAVLGFFNRNFGVPLTDGGTVRLAAAVGLSQAMDILHTGRRVYAKEALKMGLVNRVVATGTALGQAVNLAFSIAKYQMASIKHDRDSVYANANSYERPGFRVAARNEVTNMNNEVITEMQEGVKRFKNYKKTATSGSKIDSWQVKEKSVPDWEKGEILIELEHKKNDKSTK